MELLDVLKVFWFVGGVFGLCVSAIAVFESFIDLRFVLANPELDEWSGRTLTAKQAFRDEVSILFMQTVICGIRIGAILGPSPVSVDFIRFWQTDATVVMVASCVLTFRTALVLIDRYKIWKHRQFRTNNPFRSATGEGGST